MARGGLPLSIDGLKIIIRDICNVLKPVQEVVSHWKKHIMIAKVTLSCMNF